MAKRAKIRNKASKKIFAKTGSMTNSLNVRTIPMRGGYRI